MRATRYYNSKGYPLYHRNFLGTSPLICMAFGRVFMMLASDGDFE